MKPGETINKLTLLHKKTPSKGLFRCECGEEKVIFMSNVKSNQTKSCGCFRDVNPSRTVTGCTTDPECRKIYYAWQNLKRQKPLYAYWYETFERFYNIIGKDKKPGQRLRCFKKDDGERECIWFDRD
jgi:hypothetical protein